MFDSLLIIPHEAETLRKRKKIDKDGNETSLSICCYAVFKSLLLYRICKKKASIFQNIFNNRRKQQKKRRNCMKRKDEMHRLLHFLCIHGKVKQEKNAKENPT